MNNKLVNLQSKFNLAETLIEELDSCIQEFPELLPEEISTDEPEKSILNMNQLKTDFGLMLANVKKLIMSGQRILDQTSNLDISDLKPSQIDALANLQGTIGSNIKLMMEMYKDIAVIEKTRQKAVPKNQPESLTAVNGNVTNNNIVFSGSSADLLTLINNSVKEITNV